MKITIDDFFKKSFCITIDVKQKLWFESIFRKSFSFGDHLIPNIFNGYTDKDLTGVYKCSLSHVSIVKMAKAMNLPFVVIFEDDAYPCIDIERKLSKVLDNIPDDAKILILGSLKYGGAKKVNDILSILTSWCWGSHSYIIFSSGYDDYLKEYEANPKHAADDFYGIVKNTYITNDNLFIQRNCSKSMHGHIGYIYDNINHDCPPSGFAKVEDVVGVLIDEKKLVRIADSIKFSKYASDKCIIIGSNPSIKEIELQKYIDGYDGVVIRINRLPFDEFFGNYGNRTDLLFTTEWSERTVKKYDFKNKIVINDRIIRDISKDFDFGEDKWFTTGMVCILLALCCFKKVEIFGFGIPGVLKETTASIHPKGAYDRHKLEYEHYLINIMSNVNFKDRLVVCEQKYKKPGQ